jgi:hypothetical protein
VKSDSKKELDLRIFKNKNEILKEISTSLITPFKKVRHEKEIRSENGTF